MNIPEEFGTYLLLKKLTEDGLGELFRAGRAGQEGIEQIALLRVFNGKGMDGEKLWAKLADRSAVQQTLRSPNVGSGIDLGRVRKFPYVAYDYISGKNLSDLLIQVEKQGSPLPGDHALLIAERLALALVAAYETRIQDERILHGFLVPPLVMISNEGETRLLGFEAAPGLRQLVAGGWRDAQIEPYLSPEARSGQPIHKADDVYSLGAILFELLTGDRFSPSGSSNLAATLENAVLAHDGSPLPAAIVNLLKSSLGPRDQRVSDVAAWHKTLSKLMIEGHYNPTTFNLAFFMHNLFREEIERENQEIQAEKKLKLAARVGTGAAATVALPQPAPEAKGPASVSIPVAPPVAAVPQKSGKGLFLGLAAAVVLVLAGAGWYFLLGPGKSPSATTPPSGTELATAAVPLSTEPAAPTGPTPEQLQAQINAMIEARSKEMQDKLQGQYDLRIKDLQRQLEDSRRSVGVQEVKPAPAPVRPEPVPEVKPPKPEPAPVVQESAPPPSEPAVTQPVAPAPVPAKPVPAPTPAPAAPKVQVGDLVQGGPGVTRPQVSQQPSPRYPPAARRLNKSASVDIRVLVDERGNVIQTERSGAKVGFGFDEAAEDTARRTTYRPATKDGVRVKMWTTLRVTFQP